MSSTEPTHLGMEKAAEAVYPALFKQWQVSQALVNPTVGSGPNLESTEQVKIKVMKGSSNGKVRPIKSFANDNSQNFNSFSRIASKVFTMDTE